MERKVTLKAWSLVLQSNPVSFNMIPSSSQRTHAKRRHWQYMFSNWSLPKDLSHGLVSKNQMLNTGRMLKSDNRCSTFVSTEGLKRSFNHVLSYNSAEKATVYLSYTNSKEGTVTNSYTRSLLRQYPVLAYSPAGPAGHWLSSPIRISAVHLTQQQVRNMGTGKKRTFEWVPQSKDTQAKLIGGSKLPICVNVCVCLHASALWLTGYLSWGYPTSHSNFSWVWLQSPRNPQGFACKVNVRVGRWVKRKQSKGEEKGGRTWHLKRHKFLVWG